MPREGSQSAPQVDHLFSFLVATGATFTVLIFIFVVYFV